MTSRDRLVGAHVGEVPCVNTWPGPRDVRFIDAVAHSSANDVVQNQHCYGKRQHLGGERDNSELVQRHPHDLEFHRDVLSEHAARYTGRGAPWDDLGPFLNQATAREIEEAEYNEAVQATFAETRASGTRLLLAVAVYLGTGFLATSLVVFLSWARAQ